VNFTTTGEGWTRHFFHGARAAYPIFSAIPLESMGGITFAAQESDGTIYQYWLNLATCTGFWQNVTTTGAVVKINDCYYGTRRGNCTWFNFMDANGNIFDFVLGFDARDATMGRYYYSLTSAWTGEFLGADWGDCQYAEWYPGTKATRAATTIPSRTRPEGGGAVSKQGVRRLEPAARRIPSR